MHCAKLFAGLAGIAFAVTILTRVHVLPHANLWLHVRGYVFDEIYWQLLIGLVCALFGMAYFGISRLVGRGLNEASGLIGFSLIAFGSVVWLICSFLTAKNSPLSNRLAILLFVAMFSFVLGLAFSAANIAWELLRKYGQRH